MGNMQARIDIKSASKIRMKSLQFGDPVTNVCAGDAGRHSYFVNYIIKSRKNRWGIVHNEYFAKCSDKKGKLSNINIDVIYKGHLPKDECEGLFDPVWQSQYGRDN